LQKRTFSIVIYGTGNGMAFLHLELGSSVGEA
jgi:hypothetical protein